MASSINGHEYLPDEDHDLQYACVFDLVTAKDCAGVGESCNCKVASSPDYAENDPLCQDPQGGGYSTVQRFAKAYPGSRQFQVAQALGAHAIAASICPKVVTGSIRDPGFGFNPVFAELLTQLDAMLK